MAHKIDTEDVVQSLNDILSDLRDETAFAKDVLLALSAKEQDEKLSHQIESVYRTLTAWSSQILRLRKALLIRQVEEGDENNGKNE